MRRQDPDTSDARASGLVIFDFDGVVVDSEVISLTSLRDALEAAGVGLTLAQVRERFLGNSVGQIEAFLRDAGRDPSGGRGFADDWYERLFSGFRAGLAPMAGLAALLDALDAAGRDYCIASGGAERRLSVALDITGLAGRFGGRVFSADRVARGKPAPDLFLLAAREMGAPPEACLVVEDSPAGIRAARSAGMPAFGFVGGSHLDGTRGAHRRTLLDLGAEAVFDHLDEIRRLV